MKSPLLFFVLAGIFGGPDAFAQPVWDPTEIARLSEQAAQLGTNLTVLINTLQTFDKLASEVGSLGARPLAALRPSETLLARLDLAPQSMPSGTEAAALITNTSMTTSELQRSRKVWASAYQTAVTDGFSLSEVATQDLASAKTRSANLGAAASSTQDLRGDVQANSAVCLAILTELGSAHAVLALLLEQQSLARLSSSH